MMQQIRSMVDSTHPITIGSWKGGYHFCRLRLHSTQLATAAAMLLGCDTRRKTFDLCFPELVESAFHASLIRGIFDGDGSWAFRKQFGAMSFSISSASISFLVAIQNTINNHCFEARELGHIYQATANCNVLQYWKIEQCERIGIWLYPKTDIAEGIFMHKKYERFKLFQKLLVDNGILKRCDWVPLMKQHLQNEIDLANDILNELIAMSENRLESPAEYHFRKTFNNNLHE